MIHHYLSDRTELLIVLLDQQAVWKLGVVQEGSRRETAGWALEIGCQ